MNEGLFGLFRLHRLAAQRGEGLRPELAEVLNREMDLTAQGVIRLEKAVTRTPPCRQVVSEEELSARGIPILAPNKPQKRPLTQASRTLDKEKSRNQ
ncbi:MAG: hypothetical protein AAGF45_07375 [Pseudomonadota bacterium]